MAKRLTDTDKWKKPFIRTLTAEYKLFWLYILDDCDHAGIWQVDIEVAQIRLGIKLSLEKARGSYGDRIVEFDGGTKWFVPDFIGFQYGSLTEKNKMYNSVISQIEKYSLMGHLSSIYGGKVQVQDKDKVQDTFGKSENLLKTIYTIEHCSELAMNDQRWVDANKATKEELQSFNRVLEQLAVYEKNPADYKQHFSNLKRKCPDRVRPMAKVLSIDELRQAAKDMTEQETKNKKHG